MAQCHVRSSGTVVRHSACGRNTRSLSEGSRAPAVWRSGASCSVRDSQRSRPPDVTPVAKTCWPPTGAALTQHGCSAAADFAGPRRTRIHDCWSVGLLASRPSWSWHWRGWRRAMASILQTATSRRNEVGTIGATEPHVRGMPEVKPDHAKRIQASACAGRRRRASHSLALAETLGAAWDSVAEADSAKGAIHALNERAGTHGRRAPRLSAARFPTYRVACQGKNSWRHRLK